jgi:S-DNA-T family DNA segregation ATPase FtsK/SpoIIIE
MGLGTDGPVSLDLTEHGPHALVAGTTRAGKSEFIKTFVAALALVNHPDDLSFLFIDFKGGADYRILERLPHAVDLSTSEDLDDFERATRLLDAEINRRRKHFDRAETNTIEGYGAARRDDPSLEPIGRLVVIADEFAKLVRQAPMALDRFVGVAQTGAAFGVHLLLATQRPAGAVTGQIDANVALRICFRVASVDDSSQVIDAPDAARIAQRDRGRAFFRAHNEALVEFQCARVGGPRKGSNEARADARAEIVLWHEVGRVPPLPKRGELPDRSTDLWDVVEACRGAATQLGWRGSSVPWPKPLPERVTIEQLPAVDDEATVPFAVADDANEQRHRAIGLRLHHGHVAVVGSPGSGRTTTLLSAACSAAQRLSAADVHLHVLDFAGGRLRPLVDLPHCGGTAFDDWEQASRLVRDLTTEVTSRLELFARRGFPSIVEQRTSGDAPLPFLLLVIDGWEAIAEERMRLSLPDEITALLTRGLSAGVRVVLAGDRVVATDKAGRAISDKLILRFNEESDYTAFGLSMRDVPESQPPGRAIVLTTREIAQVAVVGDDLTQAIKELAAHVRERDQEVLDRWPQRLEPLPREISLAELTERRLPPAGDRVIPVGLGADRNEPRYVDLADLAGGFVIAGPPRSGRTTALRAIATFLSDLGTSTALVTPRASALSELSDLPGVVAAISGADARRLDLAALAEASVVLIDDAELLDDAHEAHAELLAGDQSVVVAGDIGVLSDATRGWLAAAKKAKAGVLLSPRARQDGGVLGTRLPDELVFTGPPGRAVMGIGGVLEFVQVPLA